MTIRCPDSVVNSCKIEGSTWGMKAIMVGIHVLFVGALFLLDSGLIRETRLHPWYTVLYLLLLVLTLLQYFYTAGSSPGYVLDVMNGKYVVEADMKHARDTISWYYSNMGNNSASSVQTQVTLHIGDHSSGTTSYGVAGGKGLAQVTRTTEKIPSVGSSSRNWSCPYCHAWQLDQEPWFLHTRRCLNWHCCEYEIDPFLPTLKQHLKALCRLQVTAT